MHESFNALMPLIIPEGVSDYFEMTHYSKSEIGVDVFGSERVYIDKYVTNEVISLSFV